MVRAHLDLKHAALSDRLTEKEMVQKRATKMIPALKNLLYKDRLKACICQPCIIGVYDRNLKDTVWEI